MQALILQESRELLLTEYDATLLIGNKDVEISIVMAGICGTDLAVIAGREDGKAGIIRGHEAVGVISRLGNDVSELEIGMRVVIDPNQYCGECAPCRSGKTHLCTGFDGALAIAGVNKHGTFAERFVCHQRFVYPLPEEVSWEVGVLIEPVACVLNTLEAAALKAGERMLLIGSGPMSLVAQLLCRRLGIETVALETNPRRRALGRELGLCVLSPDELGAQERFDAVLDSAGNQLELAVRYLQRGGRILLFGFDKNYLFPLPAKEFLVNGFSIIGAGEYNQNFADAINMVKRMPELGKLVTHSYSLSNYRSAIAERFINGGDMAMKSVFVFDVRD